jgi:tetratricopeptide (TPR) repeat protein
LEVAERAEVDLVGGRQAGELARLELEHGNIRAAVAWMLRAEQAESVLRLASALWRFLFVRGHFAEGRAWLESGLEVAGDPPPELLAKALGAAARLTGQLGDLDVAGDYAERSLELHRRHDLATLPSALGTLAAVLLMEGELDRAAALQQEAIQLSRQNGDLHGEAINIENLGCVHLIRGDYHTADSFLRRSSELFRQLGHREPLGFSLLHLGQVALHQGRYDEAVQLLGDSLAVCREVGSKAGLSYCLEMLATVAVARDRAKDAAMLLGCAQEMEKEIGLRLEPFEQGVHDRAELSAIAALGEDGFARERARGSEMMLDEVLSHALAASPQGPDVAASAGRRQPRY